MAELTKIREHLEVGEREPLRIGIFIDRAEAKAAAIILNTRNNRYSFLTDGEHAIADADDWDSVCEAVNACCDDILRWANETEAGQTR